MLQQVVLGIMHMYRSLNELNWAIEAGSLAVVLCFFLFIIIILFIFSFPTNIGTCSIQDRKATTIIHNPQSTIQLREL